MHVEIIKLFSLLLNGTVLVLEKHTDWIGT